MLLRHDRHRRAPRRSRPQRASELHGIQRLVRQHPRARQGRRGHPPARTLGPPRHRRERRHGPLRSPGAPARAPARRSMLAVAPRRLIDGRLAPSVDDVVALAEPVLKHRMALLPSPPAPKARRSSGVIIAPHSGGGDERWQHPRGHAEVGRRSRRRKPADLALEREAHSVADRLPDLLLEARCASPSTVAHGIHGRRRAGPGETFWQFPHYEPQTPPPLIDWRRSASSDSISTSASASGRPPTRCGCGPTLSPSMDFQSHLCDARPSATAR